MAEQPTEQLEPTAPREPEKNEASFIRTHGGTPAEVLRAERQMQAIAAKEGLTYVVDRLNANTYDLHRVTQFAGDHGRGFEFFAKVQDGFFAGTHNPFAPDVLAGVAESAGLPGQRVREILATGEYADRVRADHAAAVELGATGVPFVVLDRRVAAAGAQRVEVYGRMLDQVAGAAQRSYVS